MKFRITYPTGLSEVITSECESLDALAMSVWGRISAEAVKLEHNVLIALHIEDAPAAEPAPMEPTAEAEPEAADAPAPAPAAKKRAKA